MIFLYFFLFSCYEWDPKADIWNDVPDLSLPRSEHMMAHASINGPTLVLAGDNPVVEVRGADGTWSRYGDLPSTAFRSTRCLIQYQGRVFSIISSVQEIDVSAPVGEDETLPFTDLGNIPRRLAPPSRCAGVEIDGKPGKRRSINFTYKDLCVFNSLMNVLIW